MCCGNIWTDLIFPLNWYMRIYVRLSFSRYRKLPVATTMAAIMHVDSVPRTVIKRYKWNSSICCIMVGHFGHQKLIRIISNVILINRYRICIIIDEGFPFHRPSCLLLNWRLLNGWMIYSAVTWLPLSSFEWPSTILEWVFGESFESFCGLSAQICLAWESR